MKMPNIFTGFSSWFVLIPGRVFLLEFVQGSNLACDYYSTTPGQDERRIPNRSCCRHRRSHRCTEHCECSLPSKVRQTKADRSVIPSLVSLHFSSRGTAHDSTLCCSLWLYYHRSDPIVQGATKKSDILTITQTRRSRDATTKPA